MTDTEGALKAPPGGSGEGHWKRSPALRRGGGSFLPPLKIAPQLPLAHGQDLDSRGEQLLKNLDKKKKKAAKEPIQDSVHPQTDTQQDPASKRKHRPLPKPPPPQPAAPVPSSSSSGRKGSGGVAKPGVEGVSESGERASWKREAEATHLLIA
jgi:hypothetical protein